MNQGKSISRAVHIVTPELLFLLFKFFVILVTFVMSRRALSVITP